MVYLDACCMVFSKLILNLPDYKMKGGNNALRCQFDGFILSEDR